MSMFEHETRPFRFGDVTWQWSTDAVDDLIQNRSFEYLQGMVDVAMNILLTLDNDGSEEYSVYYTVCLQRYEDNVEVLKRAVKFHEKAGNLEWIATSNVTN